MVVKKLILYASLAILWVNSASAMHEKLYAKDFAALGIEYRDSLDFSFLPKDYVLSNDIMEDTLKQDYRNWLYGPLVSQHYHAPVYLKFVNSTVNYGVFAERDFVKGELIAEYTGRLVEHSVILPGKTQDYAWNYVDNEIAIDGYASGNFTRFVNHSYRPNLKCKSVWVDGAWHLIYIVAKPIKKDEQLFISYGWKYWVNRGIEPEELNFSN